MNVAQMPVQQQPAAVQKPAQNNRNAPPANEPRKVKFSVGRDYQVMTVIGEGAYGVVVRAVHRASGREVAIKKVSSSYCPHVTKGFTDQSRAMRFESDLSL